MGCPCFGANFREKTRIWPRISQMAQMGKDQKNEGEDENDDEDDFGDATVGSCMATVILVN